MTRPKKSFRTATLVGVLLAGCASRSDEPTSRTSANEERTVILPPRISRALAASGRDFRTIDIARFDSLIVSEDPEWPFQFDSRQSPSTVVGDFDGDGAEDAALLQESATESRFVIVLDRSPVAEIVELERWPRTRAEQQFPMQEFLARVPAGPYVIPFYDVAPRETTLHLRNEAVSFIYFEKGAVLYYYENGRFQEIITAD